jgi:hypothetical protein
MAAFGGAIPGYEAQRATGQAEIGEAARALETAGDACGLVCPALQSFRVGVRHRCQVAEMKEDEKVCKELRMDLVAREAHYRPTCGSCLGGKDAGGDDASP